MSLASRARCLKALLGLGLLIALGVPLVAAGTISGRITEQGTGSALPNIDVDILDAQYQSVTTTARSNASGNYQITNLPAGNYVVRADSSATQGYVDQYNSGVFLRSQAPFLSVPGNGTVTVNFSLFKGANLSGRITISSGPGAGGGAAQVDLDLYEANTGEFLSSLNASTNNAGNYTIGSLPPGLYVLRADPVPTTFLLRRYYLSGDTRATATPITVVGTTPISGINFSLPHGGLIRGIVKRAGTSTPLADIDLDLYDASGVFQAANATTTATGYYQLGPVLPGTYFVKADPTASSGYVQAYHADSFLVAGATPVTVNLTAITTGVDIALSPGGTLSGAVRTVATQQPLEGIDLDVYNPAGQLMPVDAKSDAVGHYLVGALPAGPYLVRANPTAAQSYATQYYPSSVFAADATPVMVAVGSDTPGVNFALSRGGIIEGIITGADTSGPLAGIDLDLFDTAGRFYSTVDAITSATGYYRLAPLPPGIWVLQADPSVDQGYVDEYYGGEYALSRATHLVLESGVVRTGIDLVLDPGGTISGHIQHRDTGQPLAGIDLDVFFPDRRRLGVTTKTDAAGDYLLGLLPAGPYLVRADPPAASGLAEQYYDGVYDTTSAQPVQVSVGADRPGVDFQLGPMIPLQPGDLNGDGALSALDLLRFSLDWRTENAQSPADLDGQPPVDQADLLELIELLR